MTDEELRRALIEVMARAKPFLDAQEGLVAKAIAESLGISEQASRLAAHEAMATTKSVDFLALTSQVRPILAEAEELMLHHYTDGVST